MRPFGLLAQETEWLGTLLIVLLIILLLFSDRIADVGRGLGEGVRNFKRGLGDRPPPARPPAPPLQPLVQQAPRKLLPAKGETTRGFDEPADGTDSETRKV